MKETSRFYSSLGLMVILNAVIKPIWIFGIDRQVQNTVGISEYGTYFAIFNLSIVFSFLLDWGFTTYFNTQVASQKEKFIDKTGHFLVIKLFFALLFAVMFIAAAYFSGIRRWEIITGVILIQIFTSLFIFFRAIITAAQWFNTDGLLSVLDKSLMILVCGSFLLFPSLFGRMSIQTFLMIQGSSTAFAMLTAGFILLRKKVVFIFPEKQVFFEKKIWLSAFPFAAVILLMSVHYRMDGFLLERIHPAGSYEAGVYAGAYRLLDAANMVSFLFSSFLLPYAARQWSNKNDITAVVLSIRHLLMIYAIVISGVIILLAPQIQFLLYDNNDAASIEVLQFCLPALIGYVVVNIYGTLLTATGYIRTFVFINAMAVLINISINLLLIPSLGAKGSCVAALVSQFACGGACLLAVKKKLNLSIHKSSFIIYIFIAAMWVILFVMSKDVWPGKISMVVIGCIATLFITIISGLIQPAKWFHFFKTQLSINK